VVERVEFVEDQITIKRVIPVSDVRLRRNQHYSQTPITTGRSTIEMLWKYIEEQDHKGQK
jgi:hypothetical protein